MEQQNKYRVIVSERATQMLVTPHFWHRSAQKRQNGSQPSLKRPQIP